MNGEIYYKGSILLYKGSSVQKQSTKYAKLSWATYTSTFLNQIKIKEAR